MVGVVGAVRRYLVVLLPRVQSRMLLQEAAASSRLLDTRLLSGDVAAAGTTSLTSPSCSW